MKTLKLTKHLSAEFTSALLKSVALVAFAVAASDTLLDTFGGNAYILVGVLLAVSLGVSAQLLISTLQD